MGGGGGGGGGGAGGGEGYLNVSAPHPLMAVKMRGERSRAGLSG